MMALASVVLSAVLMVLNLNCKLHTRTITWMALQASFFLEECADHSSDLHLCFLACGCDEQNYTP